MKTNKLVKDYLTARPWMKHRKNMEEITLDILIEQDLLGKGVLMIRSVHSIGRELRRVIPNDEKGVRLEKQERARHGGGNLFDYPTS